MSYLGLHILSLFLDMLWGSVLEKQIKCIQIGKEEVQVFIICSWIAHYTVNPKDYAKNLEIINEFSKVVGYKIDIQKSAASFYTYN